MWITKDQDERDFFGEIGALPDRLIGLLAPVVIDRRLTAAMKARLRDYNLPGGSSVFADLFEPPGELGDLGTRIRLGLAMGLYGAATYADIRLIVKIRNAFAHRLETRDFNSQQVKGWTSTLKIVERYPAPPKSHPSMHGGEVKSADDLWSFFLVGAVAGELKDPRVRFLRAAELLSGLLLREETDPNPNPLSPRF
jgi:hypothetical protein